ncbi:MAG: DUF4388 domain-containing protein [Actinomycetota bacterium]
MEVIRGDLGLIGVPDLFRAIADESRSGRLSLSRQVDEEAQSAIVYFREGDTYHARLIPSGTRLGTRVVSAGLVSNEDIEKALELQKEPDESRRLGQILIDSKLVRADQLEAIVRQQIEDTIFEVLRWDGGEFAFEPQAEIEEDVKIEISVENLIMEGARRFREWHHITRRVPTLEAVPKFSESDDDPVEVALTPEEWALVSRVDGRSTVLELGSECGFTDLEAARTVSGLVGAGLLVLALPVGTEYPSYDPEVEEALDELERALEEASRDRTSEGRAPVGLEQLVAASGKVYEAAEETSESVLESVEEQPAGDLQPSAEPAPVPGDEPVFEVSQEGPAVDALTELPEESMQPEAEVEVPVAHEPTITRPEVSWPAAEVELVPPDAAESEGHPLQWDDVSTEGLPEPPPEDAGTRIISEETVIEYPSQEHTSVAGMFSDLHLANGQSVSEDDPGPAPETEEPAVTDAAEAAGSDGAEEEPVMPDASGFEVPSAARPVDPFVDTHALIREFTALGQEEEEDVEIKTSSAPRPPQKTEEGKRGLFGRRRRP